MGSSMRISTLSLFGALGFAASVAAAGAAPIVPTPTAPQVSANIMQVAGGCGRGFHRYRGYCVRNRRHRPYAYYHRHYRYGHYRPYRYYGSGYQPWNRPSPGDYVADQLNAQELYRNYWVR